MDTTPVANSIDRLGHVLEKFDVTPSPTKEQWIRDAAVKLAVGMMRPLENTPLSDDLRNVILKDAVKMAEGIWLETRKL